MTFTGHYYDLQPIRRHFNLQMPEPIANSHPHDEAMKLPPRPLFGSPNPMASRKGIDFVFGLQRWAQIPAT